MPKETTVKSKKSTTATKGKAVAYLRVSTEEQMEKRNSIEEQKRLAIQYAQTNELILDDSLIYEEAKPASTMLTSIDNNLNNKKKYVNRISIFEKFGFPNINFSHRPQLDNILQLAMQKKISHLIVYSRDRLARNVDESIAINYIFNKCNVKIHYSRPGEFYSDDSNDLYGDFLEIILSSVAEFEINILSSRVKMGCEANIKQGFWAGGRLPFGYTSKKIYKNKSLLKAIPFEQSIVEEIYKYYNLYGYSYKKIASIMKEKYKEYAFDINWNKNNIESIIKNETYTGFLIWDRRGGRRNPGKKESPLKCETLNKNARIIDAQTWQSTNKLRQKKGKVKDNRYFNTPFILKEKLICGKCGSTMQPRNYGKGKKSVYRCPNQSDGISECILEKNMIHNSFIKELKRLVDNSQTIHTLYTFYKQKVDKKEEQRKTVITNLRNRITELENFKSGLKELIIRFKKQVPSLSEEEIASTKPASKDKYDAKKPKTIQELIEEQLMETNNKIIFYDEQLEHLKNLKISPFKSSDHVQFAIRKIFDTFSDLEQEKQRMFVDIIVDQVEGVNKSVSEGKVYPD